MPRELTKVCPIPWKLLEHKPKYSRVKKACRFLCTALLGLCCIYHTEMWLLGQNAENVLANAANLRSVLTSDSGYPHAYSIVDRELKSTLHQVMGVNNASWFPGNIGVEFSEVRLVHSDAGSKPYLVFFLEDVRQKFAQQLTQVVPSASKKLDDDTEKGHCNATQANIDGRFSFCLTL